MGFSAPPALPDRGFQVWNVKHPVYGATGNAVVLTDGVMDGATGILTSVSATFTASDVGKTICVSGAGPAGAHLATTIASRQSATQVTLTAVSATAVAAARVLYGTDDRPKIQDALNAASAAGGGVALLPRGTCLISAGASLTIPAKVRLEGQVRGACVLIRAGTGNVPVVVLNGAGAALRRITVDGNYWQVTANNFRDVYVQADDVEITECLFRNWPSWAVQLDTSTRAGFRFERNKALGDASAPGGMASSNTTNAQILDLQNATDFYVGENRLEAGAVSINWDDQATYPGSGVGGGIQMLGAKRGHVHKNLLTLHHRTNDGITHWGCEDVETDGNIVLDPHDDGITYRDNGGVLSKRIQIHHNILVGTGTGGIFCPSGTGYTSIDIHHNAVFDSGRSGISFNGAVNSRCCDNLIDTVSGRWGSAGLGLAVGSLSATTDSEVSRNEITQVNGTGIDIANTCPRMTVRGNRLQGIGYSRAYYAIHLNAADCTVADNDILASGWGGAQGWATDGGGGTSIGASQGIFCNSSCRTPKLSGNRVFGRIGVGINIGNAAVVDAVVTDNEVSGTIAGSASQGDGISTLAPRTQISGNKVQDNHGGGILVNGAHRSSVTDNLVVNNGRATAGGQPYGIRLMGSVTWCLVEGNQAYDDQATPTQNTNISEATGADYNTIRNNHCQVVNPGNAALAFVGAHTIVERNRGYLDQASGTATVANGGTTVDVTHGLAVAPTRVQLTPTADTGGHRYWVSAKGAATFTITTEAAVGADTTFDWRAWTQDAA